MEPFLNVFTVSERVQFYLLSKHSISHSLNMSEMFDLFLDQGKLLFWSEIIQFLTFYFENQRWIKQISLFLVNPIYFAKIYALIRRYL